MKTYYLTAHGEPILTEHDWIATYREQATALHNAKMMAAMIKTPVTLHGTSDHLIGAQDCYCQECLDEERERYHQEREDRQEHDRDVEDYQAYLEEQVWELQTGWDVEP